MIKLVSDTINRDDINSLIEWLEGNPIPRLTKGDLTVELERKWARKLGTNYSVFVNSGSSAILLTLAALLYQHKLGGVKLNSKKVVVSSLAWATDLSSIMLLGYEPILCDINLTDLSCDLDKLEEIFRKESPEVFILVSPLGLVPDMEAIVKLCKRYGVILLEDVCESMGSKYKGKYLGTFGEASFFSMYYGHHLSTIEGGFINTNNEYLYHTMLMMRSHGWDRDLPDHMKINLRENYGISDFDAMYRFYLPGFNLRSTDLQAFLGLRMIDRLDEYAENRNNNFILYLENINNNMIEPGQKEDCFVSNFAFPVAHENRDDIIVDLNVSGIETRPLIAGNLANHPVWGDRGGKFPKCDLIDKFGFYVPNHQDLTEDDILTICRIINYY